MEDWADANLKINKHLETERKERNPLLNKTKKKKKKFFCIVANLKQQEMV